MYEVGMYGGSFNPLHLGHVNDIIMAANQCKKLFLVLSVTNDSNEIDHRERLMWLKNITSGMDNVEVIEIFDNNDNKENIDWDTGAADIKKAIGRKIDVVFAGDDYKDRGIWERLYEGSKIVYFPRNEVKVSSSMIREKPFKYYDFLPRIVQRYYVKKVCVIGTESCGKTTLVRNLANYFNTSHVEEAGRYVCDDAGGIDNMQKYHYFQILFKHKELEREALESANRVLFIDTDSLITLYYYQLGFDDKGMLDAAFANIAEGISVLNNYDLYLFLEPDVEWVQDGTRTYGDDVVRERNNQILKELFDKNGVHYEVITGDYQERYVKAKKKVLEIMR